MGRRFLIVSADMPCKDAPPLIVVADDAVTALRYFQVKAMSKETIFRDSVLDLSYNMSFAERFYLATAFERERLERDHQVGTEPEIVKSRVKKFFAKRPDLGSKYLEYMETENTSLITEEVFEFIAESEEPEACGLVALDLDEIPIITAT